MWQFIRQTYLNNRFFVALACVGIAYVFAFFFNIPLIWVHFMILLLGILLLVDWLLLFVKKNPILAQRILPEKLSNGDENWVKIDLNNNYNFNIKTQIIDEVPFQFQLRDFNIKKDIKKGENVFFEYPLHPKERGEYSFGSLNVLVKAPLGLISRKLTFNKDALLPAYPSFIHLKKYELMAMQNEFMMGGIKKIRKIGHTMEFEQIKEYVTGDDLRTINWKTTGKMGKLMVNQYQEERAQRIYMLIDKGRTMKMPFNGLSLLDYAINASMALSHIVLKKKDNAGVMTFSRKVENMVAADGKSGQVKRIADALYNIQTNFFESDFNRLYIDLKTRINRRSLILLFTNFETLDAMNRQLPYLRGIAKNHLLVVIFFQNPEIMKIAKGQEINQMQDIYDQIIAEKFEYEKKLIRQELQKYGIHSIYTLPENLSINVINKYLEIKARGIL